MNALTTMPMSAEQALETLRHNRDKFAQARARLPTKGGLPLLRLLKDGVWVYGSDNVELEAGSTWAVDPGSFEVGYICWTDYDEKDGRKNEILGEIMMPFLEGWPDESTLPEYPYPWKACISAILTCINGEDKGVRVLYKPTSHGGYNTMSDILDKLYIRLGDGEETAVVPILDLRSDSYHHTKYGKTYKPDVRLDRWVPIGSDNGSGGAAPQSVDGPDSARISRKTDDENRQSQVEVTAEPTAATSERAPSSRPDPDVGGAVVRRRRIRPR